MHCEKKRAKQSVTSFKVQPSGPYYSALMYQSRRWPIFLILSQYKRSMYEFKGNVLGTEAVRRCEVLKQANWAL